MSDKPKVYCFYLKDEVNPHSCGDANQFVHLEDYDRLQRENEILRLALKLIIRTPPLTQVEIEINKCAFEALEAANKIRGG